MTGAGLVTSLGTGVRANWERLMRGDRAIGPVDLFDTTGARATIAAQASGFVSPPVQGASWSRTSVFAWNAAKEAIAQAGLDVPGKRVGLVVGGTTGGMLENEAVLAGLHTTPSPAPSEVASSRFAQILSHPLSVVGDCLHATLGPFAKIATLCSACSSGANALLVGALWLEDESLDAVVAGGADGLCRLTFHGFNALQAMDPEPCRPFDKARRGMSLGEGAGFVVLERAGDARARGRAPIAELAGWAASAEAHHITNPEPTGAVAAATITAALARAGLSPADVDYVNAHGTATPLNDPMEAAALVRALGPREIERVLVSSSKGQIGHTLGAAGAIEAVITAYAIQSQEVPPTAGLEDPDPACRLAHVRHAGRKAKVRAAISSSFGFGGMDAVLVLAQPDAATTRVGRTNAPLAVVITGAAALTRDGLDGSATASALAVSDAGQAGGTAGGPVAFDIGARLDLARARRLDRPARLGALVAEAALEEARASAGPCASERTGLVLGSAFGSVDGSAAFMYRLFERGARLASPAEFPNLVPSSPAGHVTIYLGVRGPALSTADLGTSAESAFALAADLVRSGEADRIVAGGVEEASAIVERVFHVLFGRAGAPARVGETGATGSTGATGATRAEEPSPRGEGGGALVVESESAARARGARVLARLAHAVEWREDVRGSSLLRALPGPLDVASARVVLGREAAGPDTEIDRLLEGTAWSAVPRLSCRARAGQHEAVGAVALVAATSLLARGEARSVLVLGLARGRGHAFVLAEPDRA